MAHKTLPELGYELDDVFFPEQWYRVIPPKEIPDDAEDELMSYTWDWLPQDEQAFFVRLEVQIFPSRERPEEVGATVVGTFILREERTIDFETFVRREAPILLFPYLREALTSLTAKGLYEPYIHPPIDIAQIVDESFSFEDATGTRTLSSREDLQKAYGVRVARAPKRNRALSAKAAKKSAQR